MFRRNPSGSGWVMSDQLTRPLGISFWRTNMDIRLEEERKRKSRETFQGRGRASSTVGTR